MGALWCLGHWMTARRLWWSRRSRPQLGPEVRARAVSSVSLLAKDKRPYRLLRDLAMPSQIPGHSPGADTQSVSGGPVQQLAEDVEVAVVASRFLDHVNHYPAA